MQKRVLIIDSGLGVPLAIAKARELGYSPIVFSEHTEAPHLQAADDVRKGECLDPAEISNVLRECRVDGVFLPFSDAALPTAFAAEKCGLPSIGSAAAALMQFKRTGFAVLSKRGLPAGNLFYAVTETQARDAASKLGLPLWIAADESCTRNVIVQLEHMEDIPLAFSRAVRKSILKAVVLMRPIQGAAYYVDGSVIDGVFRASGVISHDSGEAPFFFDRTSSAEPSLSVQERNSIENCASDALSAFECRDGAAHVDVRMTDDGPVVMDVFVTPAALRFPADLIHMSRGIDTIANALSIAVADTPQLEAPAKRGAVLHWIPTHSGVITEVRGLEEARAIPGIERIVVGVKPGDPMRHIVDCESRDRVGYVLASGEDLPAAERAAKEALNVLEIVTKPAYSQ